MSGTIVYKKNHTTRVPALYTDSDGPVQLATLDIKVVLESGDNVVTLGLGTGVGLDAGDGEFHYDVTVANLTALGEPDQVMTTINIWDASNVLLLDASGVVDSKL